MVLFVPPGDRRDATREPAFDDGAFGSLKRLGVPAIGSGPYVFFFFSRFAATARLISAFNALSFTFSPS